MNLGLPELMIVFAVALLVFGPRRLPELAKNLGKGIRDFKKALNGESAEEEEAKKLSSQSGATPPPSTIPQQQPTEA